MNVITFPVFKSHCLKVLSFDPERIVVPLGENAHELTKFECQIKTFNIIRILSKLWRKRLY